MSTTVDELGRRRGGGRRGHREPKPGMNLSEVGKPDPLVQDFERGPYPALRVRELPPEARALVERIAGNRFPDELYRAYERVRAYLGLEPVELDAALLSARPLPAAPAPEPAPVRQLSEGTGPRTFDPLAVNPHDLGD